MTVYTEILEKLYLIRGNVIADERRDALQQLKELIQDLEQKELNCLSAMRQK